MANHKARGFSGADTPESIRRRKRVSIVCIVVILILFSLIGYFVGKPLALQFKNSPETFRDYVAAHGFLGQLMMIGIVMLQVVVALIPGEPFELGAGFVFGWFEGTILCLIGMALASALVYLAVRKFGVRMVALFFPAEKINSFSFLQNHKKLDLLTFILFLIPGTPKDLLTYLIGLTPMPLHTFLWISTLARIPSVVSSAVTGSLVQSDKMLAAGITYGITAIISVACILWYRYISKQESAQTAAQNLEAETKEKD